MIKGCQKKIIQIKDTKSLYFEEAYIVLKNDCKYNENNVDIVSEATSIINRYSSESNVKKHSKKLTTKVLLFIFGAILGASLSSLIFFLII